MLYLYDREIVRDLTKSFNPDNVPNPVVKVIDPDHIYSVAAQIQQDEIQLPIVAVTRLSTTSVKTDLWNFSRLHRGVETVIDKETNKIYREKVLPLDVSYDLNIITSNTEDMDEIIKELIFKYTQMYFLTITLPYESKRQIRFGLTLDTGSVIERKSSQAEYLSTGVLHESILHLKTEGIVMVYYTPVQLQRSDMEIEVQ